MSFFVLIGSMFLFIVSLGIFFESSSHKDTMLTGDITPYTLGERHHTTLPSRKWMAYTIEITKNEELSHLTAALYFAYIASVYAEVFEKIDNTQASLAAANLLNYFFPHYKERTQVLLDSLGFGDSLLIPEAAALVRDYRERSRNDYFGLKWGGTTNSNNNSNRFSRKDNDNGGVMAREWKTWIVDKSVFKVPTPLPPGTWRDALELEKIMYAIERRTPDDEEIIFFWEGMDNFHLTPQRKRISLGALWQNILFVEKGSFLSDRAYAHHQKILAQGIADALIIVFDTKYTFSSDLPSMRIPHLRAIVTDPPYPAYVSEHAAVSAAAEVMLTTLFSERKAVWRVHARNASNSRLLAGTHFPADIREGIILGEAIGKAVIKKYTSEGDAVDSLSSVIFKGDRSLQKFAELLYLRLRRVVIKPALEYTSTIITSVVSPPAFINVAEESGLDIHLNIGASWGDYDSDGNLDLLTSRGLYRNLGNGLFTPIVSTDTRNLQAPGFFGDYNNDGCPDVYIVRSGELASLEEKGKGDLLYRNNCDGTFIDVTKESGIRDTYHGVSASWGDYNNDGFIDIYVLNRGILLEDSLDDPNVPYKFEPNILYRNNGDGTFTDVTDEAGGVNGILECDEYKADPNGFIRKMKVPFQPVWFDYDNNNAIDLFLVSDSFTSPLYRNNGDGTFTQVTKESGLCFHERKSNMGAAIGDYDSNGFLDIYVPNAGDNFLWRNNGDGTFTDVAKEVGAKDLGYGWGTEAIDYDNDGDLDIAVVNGNNRIRSKYYYVAELKHNDLDELFQNNGSGSFTPVGKAEGFIRENVVKYSLAAADYNNDGFLDLFIPVQGERHPEITSLLYRNQGNNNHWVTIQLMGTKSNRDGIGARVTLISNGKTQIREVLSGSSYIAQSSPWPSFGLGETRQIDVLTVRWPSGIIQTFNEIPIDQKIIIKEGDPNIYKTTKR